MQKEETVLRHKAYKQLSQGSRLRGCARHTLSHLPHSEAGAQKARPAEQHTDQRSWVCPNLSPSQWHQQNPMEINLQCVYFKSIQEMFFLNIPLAHIPRHPDKKMDSIVKCKETMNHKAIKYR